MQPSRRRGLQPKTGTLPRHRTRKQHPPRTIRWPAAPGRGTPTHPAEADHPNSRLLLCTTFYTVAPKGHRRRHGPRVELRIYLGGDAEAI